MRDKKTFRTSSGTQIMFFSEYRGRNIVFAVPSMNAFYDKVLLCGVTIRRALGEVVGGVRKGEQ